MLARELRRKALRVRAVPQHLIITGALALALCLLALLGTADRAQALVEGEDYRTGQVIVKLDPDVATIGDIISRYEGAQRLDEKLPYNLETRNIYLLRPPADRDVVEFVGDLLDASPNNGVLYAEPNFIAEAPEGPAGGDGRFRAHSISYRKQSSAANDTFAANLNLSCVPETNRGMGSKVAVLDTGAQLDHPALRGNFKGVERYDFVNNDRKPFERRLRRDRDGDRLKNELRGHGTHVAGIVDQVAPAAKIMPLRVLNPEGYGDVYTIARAISFAQANEADVINLSLGTSEKSALLREMVVEATENDIVVAAAAGNSEPEGTEAPHYPAAGDGLAASPEDGVLAVTSVDGAEIKSSFANYGSWVDIAAPGEDIRSPFPRGRYANWSGTSMATPFVAGQAALIRALNGSIASQDIEGKIRDKADDSIYDPLTHEREYLLRYLGKLGAGHADVCSSIEP
jgi:thermitase